jgi:hypothetical protein
MNELSPVRVYCDGSGFKGGIGASALLYIKDHLVKSLQIHLGSSKEHTVYEAKGIRVVMNLHLLYSLNCQLTQSTIIGIDNQAIIKALQNQKSHAEQYILDEIHKATKKLNLKQDQLINCKARR